ncbi:MAG: hypothetical protein GY749_13565 [Desulfobacteraceae bacterium]|nr:hypothetical protein [Desulfobacteraceae bacterium]
MNDNEKYLVVFGIPSIKKYVFGTDRLKEIRGASALLDRLNNELTENFLKNRLKIPKQDIVFLGGGAGQFIIEGDVESVKASMRKLESLYAEQTEQGIRLLWEMAEYTDGTYIQARKAAENKSGAKRDEFPFISGTYRLYTGMRQLL